MPVQHISEKIRRIISSSLVQNVGALSLVQAINYLVPLITIPYLARVLGPEEWGRVAWMQIILGYFSTLIDWGFSWSGTRKIATLRNDRKALSEVFFAGWTVQWGLCVIALTTLIGLAAYAPLFETFRAYALYGTGVIVSGVLFPIWLLAGLEQMRGVAFVQIIIRTGAVPLIFIFVRTPGDGALAIAASALTGLVGGIAAIIWINKKIILDWQWPRYDNIRAEFFESGSIFMSRFWIVLYTSLIPTILGLMTNETAVGQYVLADKIRGAVQSLLTPISHALFPRMSYLFSNNKKLALQLVTKSGKLITTLSLTTSILLFYLADDVIAIVAGPDFSNSAKILRWLSPLPFIIALSNIFGVQIMLANKMVNAFNLILSSAGIISLIMITVWICYFGIIGAAINTLLIECAVTGAMAAYLYSKREIFNAN